VNRSDKDDPKGEEGPTAKQGEEDAMSLEGIGRGKIVPIEWLQRVHRADEERTAKAETKASRSVPAEPVAPNTVEKAADEASSLSRVEERDRLMADLKAELSNLPDVRKDKVIEAKLRISTGYYNQEEVRRQILRSLLDTLGVGRDGTPAAQPETPLNSKPAAANTSSSSLAEGSDQ
jgi:hypothetical protein